MRETSEPTQKSFAPANVGQGLWYKREHITTCHWLGLPSRVTHRSEEETQPFLLAAFLLDWKPKQTKTNLFCSSAMRNQHYDILQVFLPLIFLVNITGCVSPITDAPLMYFWGFFSLYLMSHNLKDTHDFMLIYCSQGKKSSDVAIHCCWLLLCPSAMGESESHPRHS